MVVGQNANAGSLFGRQRVADFGDLLNEGEPGATNMYGPAYGLPAAISGMNENWYRGYGDLPPETVTLGEVREFVGKNFESCTLARAM